MSGSTLVSTEALSRGLGRWRLFDCRHDLARPELGESQYREAHIPGALFAHMERDLSGPKTGRNGRHPLPQFNEFLRFLEKSGLTPEDHVVCYDAANGSAAARLWWMLRWVGHESVTVLDGGLAKWTKEGRPVTKEIASFPRSTYHPRPRADAALGAGEVHEKLKSLVLVDARAPARWRGEQEPIDPVAGRIPGALNRFNMDNLTADGTFKSAAQLKEEMLAVLNGRSSSETIHYCGSGVAACHNLLAMEVAGLPGGRLYAGSWSEWIADPARPREKG